MQNRNPWRTAALCLAALLLGTQLGRPAGAGTEQIVSRRFVLVNAEGKTAGFLSCENNTPMLALFGSNGTLVTLGANDTHAALVLADQNVADDDASELVAMAGKNQAGVGISHGPHDMLGCRWTAAKGAAFFWRDPDGSLHNVRER